jgi:hypothetical protein
MSDEQYFCASCGYNSDNKERCTHCGNEIDDLYETPPAFRIPLWGRLTLRLREGIPCEPTWRELVEVWHKEMEKWPSRPGQLEKFDTSADTLELYGPDYTVSIMRSALNARGSVDFQELSHEEMPHAPPYKPRRPPTVPRNKR